MATRRLDGSFSRYFALYHGKVSRLGGYGYPVPFLKYYRVHPSADEEIAREEAMVKMDDEWWWKRATRTEEAASGYPC
jgi:hypothetical protein